ncbi:hypothetical protein NC652_006979 [Populus alba x Populus x berolinensis]|uniref:Uncharacterized protein n=1 Tax=Populus alba x Populus x berolinensis TaxID=444605 RepID=A0AAD6RFH3_9ROSI|nr:hypothetical protein NC652_006979 [Populus alba x Populus x berolinensis]KAJ7008017.1 hypothetical protein NC653_006900 [Populus alba x Populus x berolinensis]KAJ7008040.1 hypothetical protein NC653_006918 [Populus alba x Populus x berolinensis]KAJ7009128.1 hypothetical protein NC653_007694 [Populus alba x Populus x berolinensis]
MKHQRRKGVELIYGVAFKRDKSPSISGNELPVQPELHTYVSSEGASEIMSFA